MKRSYAVLWTAAGGVAGGRLRFTEEGLELRGRHDSQTIRFDEIADVAIARGPAERLRGLPVLSMAIRSGGSLRLATLEGAGVLHELADRIAAPALVL